MAAGATLGGPALTVRLLANGSIENVYSVDVGANVFRDADVHHFDAETGLRLSRDSAWFTLRPECQVHEYVLGGRLHVEKSTFVLYDASGPPACYVAFRVRNDGERVAILDSVTAARIKGSFADDVEAKWNSSARAVVVWNSSGDEGARALVSSQRPESWMVTSEHAAILENRWPGAFDESIDSGGVDPLALIHVRTRIEPQAAQTFWFALVRLPDGATSVDRARRRLPDSTKALAHTARCYDELLDRTEMLSPVGEVDLGVRWAKANMARVMQSTPTGRGFTNDPGRSSSCVGRDSAWFVHGCDWLDPSFSAQLLRGFAQRQESDGKIVEFYDLRTGKTCDDGLNVNDDTPLFAIAVWHHALATGDRGFLAELYPSARRAVDQLLANRDARGLVYCTAEGTGSRGIVGWRNIIDDYRLSGATTELNSEAFAALKRVASLATMLGKDADAERYEREATALRAAVERHLRNPANGLYYLNIDVDGRPRSTLSSDLLFPVIFGIADAETSARIVERLREADFWTEAGVRTVPRDAAEYGPVRGKGLLGGVWVSVTFWYAFAAAPFVPDVMIEALKKTFAHYSYDPIATNTVPGEFSEWLHGETLVNEGMMMSPWFAPRYLWAAIEGACGLEPTETGAKLTPRLPPNWAWLAARNVPLQGKPFSWFATRSNGELRLYATRSVESSSPVETYERDVTSDVRVAGDDVAVVAFAREGEVAVFVGNRSPHTIHVALPPEGALAGKHPRRTYNFLVGRWGNGAPSGDRAYGTTIARGGFSIIEFA